MTKSWTHAQEKDLPAIIISQVHTVLSITRRGREVTQPSLYSQQAITRTAVSSWFKTSDIDQVPLQTRAKRAWAKPQSRRVLTICLPEVKAQNTVIMVQRWVTTTLGMQTNSFQLLLITIITKEVVLRNINRLRHKLLQGNHPSRRLQMRSNPNSLLMTTTEKVLTTTAIFTNIKWHTSTREILLLRIIMPSSVV